MIQYGGEEFTPDTARFAAQKPGSSVYNADPYYLGNYLLIIIFSYCKFFKIIFFYLRWYRK